MPGVHSSFLTGDPSSSTRDSKGNIKWKGLRDHLESLIKEKPDTFRPAYGGVDEFTSRVDRGLIEPGYIIYMARTFKETSKGEKKYSLGCLGLLTNYIESSIDGKYVFAHAAIYVGKWDGVYYFVENGGNNTGKKFLSKEMGKKYCSAIQLIDAREVISDSPFMAMAIPWSQVMDPSDSEGKRWPKQEELVQKVLATVGFPFNYKLRTRSCETFILLLIGIGDMDSDEIFPQIQIVLSDISRLSKLFVGSDEITENDRIDVEDFRKRLERWLYDRRDAIDKCAFTIESGQITHIASYEMAA